jgi:hypothetical protein
MKITLLGDSIFDNARYVNPDERSVIEHLKAVGMDADLLAVDGSITLDVTRQLEKCSNLTSHFVISCGGNDALYAETVISTAITAQSLLHALQNIQMDFRINYHQLLAKMKETGIPTFVCTIYDKIPHFSPEELTLLSIFNDVIISTATFFGYSVIDLRPLCNDPKDYSELSPIEPSNQGGEKIANKIASTLKRWNPKFSKTVIF